MSPVTSNIQSWPTPELFIKAAGGTPPANERVTDTGDVRVTDTGDFRVYTP